MRHPGRCGLISALAVAMFFIWTGAAYCAVTTAGSDMPVKVGVYVRGYGAQGIFFALQTEKRVNVSVIKKGAVDLADLLAYDVVIIGSLRECPFEKTGEVLQEYVKCGGGLILNHAACGLTQNEKPLFPDIIANTIKTRGNVLLPCKAEHAILSGVPEQYEYAYVDHFDLIKGQDGEVLVCDTPKNPVVVCGYYGKGRVVANGACTGLTAQGNLEQAPAGGERQILLNAVVWAAQGRVTALSQEERNARLAAIQQEKEAQKLHHYNELMAKQYDWFDESLIRCTYLQRQPVEKTNGRILMIARVDYLNNYGYERTRQNLRQLKLMGITDIVQLTMRDCVIFHPTSVLDALPRYTTYDPFMTLVKAAGRESIGIWVKLQIGYGQVADKMLARNCKGEPYRQSKDRDLPDVLNNEYRAFLYRMIDEYVAKYSAFGSLKGLYVDMPYSNAGDYLGDNLEDFKKFTMERFGEMPPKDCNLDDIARKCNPKDVWWRRWVLFKEWVNEDFNKSLSDYCRKKGLEYAIQIGMPAAYGSGWSWGHDPYRLSSLGKSTWIFSYGGSSALESLYSLDQSTSGSGPHGSWGEYNTRSLRGHRAGMELFFDGHLWRPFGGGMTNRGIDALRMHILNCREWSGSSILAKAAVLDNQNTLLLRLGAASSQIMQQARDLFEDLSHYLDVDCIMVENTELYNRYSVLIAPPYSLEGLSQSVSDKLKEFVQHGGILLNLNSKWSISRADLTQEKNMTMEFTGLPVLEILKAPEEGFLATMEKNIGKGRIISITSHNMLKEVQKENSSVAKQFAALVCKLAEPPVVLKSENDPRMKIMTTLKKNNWVAVTLWSDDKTPARGIIRVDLQKLGLQHAGYRLLLLGRNMELLKPGDWAGGEKRGEANFWTAEDFKAGVAMTILKNDEIDLKIPQEVDVSAYPQSWADYIKNTVIAFFNKQDIRQRQYGYEIMVIAPSDELNIDGEKAD
jgi:hypothetical protein